MKATIVTGSVGTGKTRFAKKFAKDNSCRYVDVTRLVKENIKKLGAEWDPEKKCYAVDIARLNKLLVSMIQKYKTKLVIDSHMSQYLPKKYVEKCFVMKCELKELKKRLERRKYLKSKVRENLDVEIFDVCLNEAKENGHKVEIVRTDK